MKAFLEGGVVSLILRASTIFKKKIQNISPISLCWLRSKLVHVDPKMWLLLRKI